MNQADQDPRQAAEADCAHEPIHVPGAIQPHGALLTLQEPDLRVQQASANSEALLGLAPEALLGRELPALLEPESAARVAAALAQGDPAQESPLLLEMNGRALHGLLHRHDGVLIMELEPVPPANENFARHHRRLQAALDAMLRAPDLTRLCETAARAVAGLTGFERVMAYRFDADWHGEVVGEALLSDQVDSYMGLHFPASDIPEQARALYARTWLRIIPDATYTPSPLVPPLNPVTGRPLDLSYSALRSVSPVHLRYLRNMDVGASMSISLIVEGKLWGLIACHHRTPRWLPFAVRAACELFGQAASAEIGSFEKSRRLAERVEATAIQTRFFDVIASEENFADALLRYTPSLLQYMGAAGTAVILNGQVHLSGKTPPRESMEPLLTWLLERLAPDYIFATDALSSLWPQAAAWKETVSGLLAVKLSRIENQWMLWFRPEVLTTVTWAGNPNKPLAGDQRLNPRTSFAAWQQTVTGHSLPWREAERQGARELRLALNALVLRRTDRLLRLNAELERKNTDLNSFAHIASHDIKEPLRGIFHYARFLREDYGSLLDEEGLRKLDAIAALAANTNELLVALANFSRLGRIELTPRETALDSLLGDVLAALEVSLRETRVEVRRPRPLPVVLCDPVLVREVFANLISNAIKYNDKPERWVEISWREPDPTLDERGPVFTVRDNGIGIRDRNYTAVFHMFRRLNKERFAEGSGAGLAIVKSVVERHGGRVWVQSELGEGSTFLFTLK